MEIIGDSLSQYRNLEFLTASSPEALQEQIKAIKVPFNIISMYGVNASHIAWINLSVKQRTVKNSEEKVKKIKTKGVKHGRSNG